MSYLGIDLGGTKTLIAVFDSSGNILNKIKIPTNPDYEVFIREVEKNVASLSTNTNIACCVTAPGLIDRKTGMVEVLGNLGWKHKAIRDDISKVIGNIPTIIENDARVAGVAEATNLAQEYEYVLYLTISTGIGGAFLRDGKIIHELQDSEVGHMPLVYEDKIQRWEAFASGKAIVDRYGKNASEIDNEEDWKDIGERIAYGVAICCSILQPQAVVFGGGAGQYADRFNKYVKDYLEKNSDPIIKQPKALLAAKYGADPAIHGCFTILKQQGFIKNENSD
ncbi:MAG TPA: ROK family protein [Patescibacteria group bacterium]|nr:ROK family protein [Patescibacteria group bacterium]